MTELPFKVGADVSIENQHATHVVRYETDTAELCKPKFIRGLRRRWLFLKKIVVFHYRGNDDYYITEIK